MREQEPPGPGAHGQGHRVRDLPAASPGHHGETPAAVCRRQVEGDSPEAVLTCRHVGEPGAVRVPGRTGPQPVAVDLDVAGSCVEGALDIQWRKSSGHGDSPGTGSLVKGFSGGLSWGRRFCRKQAGRIRVIGRAGATPAPGWAPQPGKSDGDSFGIDVGPGVDERRDHLQGGLDRQVHRERQRHLVGKVLPHTRSLKYFAPFLAISKAVLPLLLRTVGSAPISRRASAAAALPS